MLAKAGISKIPVKGLQSASRREFLKKGGALAGSTAIGSTMLGKALSNIADEVPVATVSAVQKAAPAVAKQAYKFNTLQDYFSSIIAKAKTDADKIGIEVTDDYGWGGGTFDDILAAQDEFKTNAIKQALKDDENWYNHAKVMKEDFPENPGYASYFDNAPELLDPKDLVSNDLKTGKITAKKFEELAPEKQKIIENINNAMTGELNKLSPEAKAEFKYFKQRIANDYEPFGSNDPLDPFDPYTQWMDMIENYANDPKDFWRLYQDGKGKF
jgi:hypothetical protein